MNGSCAGGTGAFIDKCLLCAFIPEELNNIAKEHEKFIPSHLAAVCFAKSDIQPLLNQRCP